MENSGRRGSLVRSEYLIERFRVFFESAGGWHCECADFVSSSACEHSREAAGMRAAQAEITEHVATGRSQLARNLWRRSEQTHAHMQSVDVRPQEASNRSVSFLTTA